jgi:hypothetical protein
MAAPEWIEAASSPSGGISGNSYTAEERLAWIDWTLGDDSITLDGCFSAQELRDLADLMEPR